MLAVLLLAQVASATPAPAPAPAASLGTASSAVSAKPKTLADLARERKLGKKGVEGTFSVAGASGMPDVPARSWADTGDSGGTDAWDRYRAARANVEAARRAVDDEAVKKGMTSEDAAAARKRLIEARREMAEARDAAVRGR